jgi:hypothetical protein
MGMDLIVLQQLAVAFGLGLLSSSGNEPNLDRRHSHVSVDRAFRAGRKRRASFEHLLESGSDHGDGGVIGATYNSQTPG